MQKINDIGMTFTCSNINLGEATGSGIMNLFSYDIYFASDLLRVLVPNKRSE